MNKNHIGAALAAILFCCLRVHGQTTFTRPVVSEEACPIQVITATTPDGHSTIAAVRKPPGKGPFPVIINLHGGLTSPHTEEQLKNFLKGRTSSAYLAAGYMTIAATFRNRDQDPLTRDALDDCLAMIARIKKLPAVDSKSIVLWGDSGGGSLALELASATQLCAVAGQEPATCLFTGLFSKENMKGPPPYSAFTGEHVILEPYRFYTPELQKLTREKIRKIKCPVFIGLGDVSALQGCHTINKEIIIPMLREEKKTLEVVIYPGEKHGFSHNGTPQGAKKFFEDTNVFFKKYLSTQPVALEAPLVTQMPLGAGKKAGR